MQYDFWVAPIDPKTRGLKGKRLSHPKIEKFISLYQAYLFETIGPICQKNGK